MNTHNKEMTNIMNVAILLIAVATLMPQSTEAAEHVVGGASGWVTPPGGASFYSIWAANSTFRVGDTLVFNFVTGNHNVARLTKDNFDNCNVNDDMEDFNTSPARVTLNGTGEFYFACTFSSHCREGQKLSINVSSASSSLPPDQAPSPTPPTTPGAAAPPQQNSATTLVATSSLLLITVAINLLF